MTLTEKTKELLNTVYYKEKNFVGRDKLYNLVKDKEDAPTKQEVADWLNDQEVHQLHVKPKKSVGVAPIITSKPNVYYQMDLADMGSYSSHGKRYIIAIIDAFTKQAYASALTSKSEKSVLKGFHSLLSQLKKNGKTIKILQTDNGSEFLSEKMKALYEELDIKHNTSIPGVPQSQGLIERWNAVIKSYIQQDITATGKNNWPANLDKYVANYNNSYHNTIKMTPNEANKEENVKTVAENIKKKAIKRKTLKVDKIKQGDKVRVKIPKGKLEKYSTQNFSKSIYKVANVVKPKVPYKSIKYRLMDKNGDKIKNFYTANDLLKIEKSLKPPLSFVTTKD